MDLNQLPHHIFGLHDEGGEQFFTDAGKRGWIVVSRVASDAPDDFSALADAGHGVIVRLNNGYGSAGTIPSRAQYEAFANACAQYVASSRGAHIWIIGNETNLAAERPGNDNGQGGEPLTPQLYAECFSKCRAQIKNVAGHADDWVIPSPPGPWNNQTAYDGNPAGDWVHYFRDLLKECVKRNAPPDALALHTYSNHDAPMDAALVESEERAGAPFQAWHWQFRAYRDFLDVVPVALRKLPVLITEAQHLPWENRDVSWIQKAYAEINAWNAVAANQPIQALCLFRWQHKRDDPPGWSISDKKNLQNDLRAAFQNDYRARWAAAAHPPIVPKPPTEILPLAKTRWFVEEAIRQLEAKHGDAARKILSETVTPWFYASAPQHSDSLPNAQAHTTARWWCEEATRRVEAGELNEAHDILRDSVLAWLTSPGPRALGILIVQEKHKPKTHKKKTKVKKSKSKKSAAKKSGTKKSRAKKPKLRLLIVEEPKKKSGTKHK